MKRLLLRMLGYRCSERIKESIRGYQKGFGGCKEVRRISVRSKRPINNAVGGTNISGGADPGADDVSSYSRCYGTAGKK